MAETSETLTPEVEFELWCERRALRRNLVQRRIQLGVTREQMATALGVSVRRIRSIEESSDWSVATMARYTRALGARLQLDVDHG